MLVKLRWVFMDLVVANRGYDSLNEVIKQIWGCFTCHNVDLLLLVLVRNLLQLLI